MECLSEVEGVCYTFAGTLFVFGDLANEREAEAVVLPAIQQYIQGRTNWTDVDPRLLDLVYVVSQNGEIMPPEPLPSSPTTGPTIGE